MLSVICDSLYDETDYIRNYDAFVSFRSGADGLAAP